MEIREIQNKDDWENFLLEGEETSSLLSPRSARECDEKTFLQSWNWGEFNKAMGEKIWRFGIFEGKILVSVALVLKTVARRGVFLLVPHGPLLSKRQVISDRQQVLRVLLNKLREIAREEKVDFIRVSPIWQRNEENNEVFKKNGFKKAPIHVHPEASWKLDIKPSEEELLMQMRKTTRYLIHRAQKNNDIEIFQSQEIKDIETFDKLYQEVVDLQHFVPFSLEYLKNEFSAFNSDNKISLFFGKYQGKIIASAFVIFWSNIGFYHHAALSPRYHRISIAYLLQWEAIKEAKRRGCNLYDFWGFVDPKKNPEHPWAGPTLFKMGFGGKPYEYVKTQDFPISKKYWLTYLFEKLRRSKRNL